MKKGLDVFLGIGLGAMCCGARSARTAYRIFRDRLRETWFVEGELDQAPSS